MLTFKLSIIIMDHTHVFMSQQNRSNTLLSLLLVVLTFHLPHGESKFKKTLTPKTSASMVLVLRQSVSRPLNQHTLLLIVPTLVKVTFLLVLNVLQVSLVRPTKTLILILSKMIRILSLLNIFHQNLVSTPFKFYLMINKFPLPQLISQSLQIMMLPKFVPMVLVLNQKVLTQKNQPTSLSLPVEQVKVNQPSLSPMKMDKKLPMLSLLQLVMVHSMFNQPL